MQRFHLAWVVTALMLLVGFMAKPASADSLTTLDQLLEDSEIFISGDLVFSNFTYSPNTANAPDASQISVVAVDHGIKFAKSLLATNDSEIDFDLSFIVTAPGMINNVTLSSTAYATGDSSVQIIENVNTPYTHEGLANFSNLFLADLTDNYYSASIEPDEHALLITKDIGLVSANGRAGLSEVTQTFDWEYVGQSAPTPSTLGCGVVLGLITLTRRRRAK